MGHTGINTGIFGRGEQGCVLFVHAMMLLHTIYCENSVVYTKQNQRLSIDFNHNVAINP